VATGGSVTKGAAPGALGAVFGWLVIFKSLGDVGKPDYVSKWL